MIAGFPGREAVILVSAAADRQIRIIPGQFFRNTVEKTDQGAAMGAFLLVDLGTAGAFAIILIVLRRYLEYKAFRGICFLQISLHIADEFFGQFRIGQTKLTDRMAKGTAAFVYCKIFRMRLRILLRRDKVKRGMTGIRSVIREGSQLAE